MFNEKDILTRLQNGEDVETIAQEVINLVNKANKIYEDEQAKRAEELAKEKKIQEQKNDMKNVLLAVEAYIKKYCPSVKATRTVATEENINKSIKMIDETCNLLKSIDDLGNMLDKKCGDLAPKMDFKSCDDVLFDFLKEHKW